MNTKELYQQFLRKKKAGAPVDMRDLAVRMANEEDALLSYMVHNDPEQVSALLHESKAPYAVGQNAKFIPDPQRLEAELKQLLVRKDFTELNKIVSSFRIYMASADKRTTNPELLHELEKLQVATMDRDGEMRFKLRIS